MRVVLIASILAATLVFVTNVSAELRGYVFYISIIVVAAWALGTLIERFIFASNIKSSPLLRQSIVYKASQSGLQIESPVSTSMLSWNAFHKTAGTLNGVLLFQQKRLFNWLPKTAFTSEADYNRFLDLLAAKTKHSKLG